MNLITHPRSWIETQKRLKDYQNNIKENWDIVLPPMEVVKPSIFGINANLDNWGNNYLNVDQNISWFINNAKRKIAVFVIDTAGKFTNKYLEPYALNEYGKVFTGETSPIDGNGHGTHCGGIIAANHPTHRLGIARALAEKGLLKVIPLKALNNSGSGQYGWIKNAIDYVADVNIGDYVKVISMSLGGSGSNAEMDAAMKNAIDKGVYIFASAGNSGYKPGFDSIGYPGNSEFTICNGSIDQSGERSSFASVGKSINFTGPGRGIWSTYKDDSIVSLNGTSMSNPEVVATACAMLSAYPEIIHQQHLINVMADKATDLMENGWDQFTGHGVVKFDSIVDIEIPRYDPGDNPDEPVDEPPVEEPVKENRALVFPLYKDFETIYKDFSNPSSDFKTVKFNLVLEMETTRMAELQYDTLFKAVDNYFVRRGFGLFGDSDIKDAAYWICRFLNMHLERKENIKVSFKEVLIWDENNNRVLVSNPLEQNVNVTKAGSPTTFLV
jgi:hypothetical protein